MIKLSALQSPRGYPWVSVGSLKIIAVPCWGVKLVRRLAARLPGPAHAGNFPHHMYDLLFGASHFLGMGLANMYPASVSVVD
jgi:hypothetical protein